MPVDVLTKIKQRPLHTAAVVGFLVVAFIGGCISTERTVKQPTANPPMTRDAQLQSIGQKIYQNETGGKIENLIFWSPNEGFPSLGVGHFIWFPAHSKQGFTESFPDMVRYLKTNGAAVPDWLMQQIQIGALWSSREQMEQSRGTPRFLALQQFLIDTSGLQVAYLFKRLDEALPKLVKWSSPERRDRIINRFYTVKSSPGGMYPLVDYVNFKGEGLVTSEKHNGVGWGLLQVLELMEPTPIGPAALKEFATAANLVLTRRVANAPPERNEQRWLPGWRVRLKTYYQ